ncbi:MAG TPA: hypothetical protein VHM20_04895 [Gammaproteobacteria bacterium]|jgi:hypothetical protein|nr:hypothetical protein [Gammaproteobacteria bacterium]
MPHIIIYPPIFRNSESKSVVQEKIINLVENSDIEIVEFQELTTYQKERAFIYGDKAYGHAAAVICISGEEPIPFGVISADINNKKLPVIVYIENNDKARKVYTDYCEFLEDTNTQLRKHLSNVDSFHLKNANHIVIHEEESEKINKIKLVQAIQKTHSAYLQQSEEKRKVRMESTPPTNDQLNEKRILFSKKEGFSRISNSLEEFKSHLDKDRLTVSFFGMIFAPITDKCEWASELGHCNLIYGLGGANKDKSLKEQSVMYQFAHYAKMGGCKIYGTIPFGQVAWGEKLDFSIGIESCYITPQLQERMDAFKMLSQFFIVGSIGTGTYEEVMDTLRTNPLTYIMIMNDEGGNKPLVTFLEKHKDKYPNVTVANNRTEFKAAFDKFRMDFQKTKLKTTSPISTVGLYAQSQPRIESLSSEISLEIQLKNNLKVS